jgi:histidinol-phosphate aminotransferase
MNTTKDHAVRLNMNENPFGPSPRAMLAAMKNLRRSNFYLYPTIEKLYSALMQHNGINKDMIILGTGSWEILRIAPLAYFENGGNVVSTRQTYKPPLDYAERLGLIIRKVDHTIDPQGHWQYNIEGLLKAVDSQTRLLYLVNPNNPTGAWLDYQQLKYIADSLPPEVLLLIDEAYIHFLGSVQENGIDLIKEGYENVLVTRTFSKVYGLAGLRVGYGVSHPDVIKRLQEFAIDFLSINASGFYGAIAALKDTWFVSKSIRQAQKTLSFYREWLSVLGLPYIIGKGPFVMVDVSTDADIIVEEMAKKHILVTGGSDWDMPTYIRISYGTDADNQRAINALWRVVSG